MNVIKTGLICNYLACVMLFPLLGCGRFCSPATHISSSEDVVLDDVLGVTIVGVFGVIEGRCDKEMGIGGVIPLSAGALDASDNMIRVPVGLWFYRASVAAKIESGSVKRVPIYIDSCVAASWTVLQERDRGERVDCDINASFRDVLTLICQRSGGLHWRIMKGVIVVEPARAEQGTRLRD